MYARMPCDHHGQESYHDDDGAKHDTTQPHERFIFTLLAIIYSIIT
jgi:hypothetical protein